MAPTIPKQDIYRDSLKNCPHTVWGQTFVSLEPHNSELESHAKEVEAVKVKVKNMLLHSRDQELTNNIQLINLLCRLGVSYHFEDEINEQLNRIFTMLPKLLEDNDYDLCTLANLFRVLRQNGYKMTCDVFEKFKDEDGEFKEDIADDVKGILCLYEACHVAIPGEDILDEALAFTRIHLKMLAETSSPCLQKHIKNALTYASHRTPERVDVLHYISFYAEDESADETLLKFAKLDYNALQLLYRKELALLTRWWINSNAVESLPYVRDRIVEAYTWTLGTVFEPQHSTSRILVCKYLIASSLLDDTYDSYGTINELRLLTNAFQRFTRDAGEGLPEYMKYLYKFVYELTMENDDTRGCSCKITYAIEIIKELVRVYLEDAIWQKERIAPSFEKYTKNGKVTCTYEFISLGFILAQENMGMKEIVWLRNDPDIVVCVKLHIRFLNDINGVRTDETVRDDFPKAVDCYTKEYGVSKDEAVEALLKILENKWKAMNEDLVTTTVVPKILLKYTLNFTRDAILFYQDIDLYTYRHNLKPLITSLFINPLPM
ncbi:Terpenoid cyclases/Protein prenyltransferases superfamily protein [Euphorbia peplus]|nr:Terpenoid cyclases/Protein prenyltransferases superfamily protein [Euphorbia peplus]